MSLHPDWHSSYLVGNKTDGSGSRYFFTFYNEFGERTTVAAVEIFVLGLTFCTSIIANCIFIVLLNREKRNVTNLFVLNLAVADCLLVLGIPVIAFTRASPHWQLGNLPCRLLPYSQFVCGSVLLWTLTLISMDRQRCIVVPPYRSQFTPRLAVLVTAATWALAAVLFCPVLFWFREDPSLQICTLVIPQTESVNVSLCVTVAVPLISMITPVSMLVYFYVSIFNKLIQLNRPMLPAPSDDCLTGPSKIPRTIAIHQIIKPGRQHLKCRNEIRLRKRIRSVRVILLNVLAVVMMWFPLTGIFFLIYFDGRRPTHDTGLFLRSHHFIWALTLAYLNALVNPLLYGLMSDRLREPFCQLLTLRKRNTSCSVNNGSESLQRAVVVTHAPSSSSSEKSK